MPLAAMLFGLGLMLPNAPVLALSRHGESTGTASALLGATQCGIAAVAAPAVGVLGNEATAMGIAAAATLLAITTLSALARRHHLPSSR